MWRQEPSQLQVEGPTAELWGWVEGLAAALWSGTRGMGLAEACVSADGLILACISVGKSEKRVSGEATAGVGLEG